MGPALAPLTRPSADEAAPGRRWSQAGRVDAGAQEPLELGCPKRVPGAQPGRPGPPQQGLDRGGQHPGQGGIGARCLPVAPAQAVPGHGQSDDDVMRGGRGTLEQLAVAGGGLAVAPGALELAQPAPVGLQARGGGQVGPCQMVTGPPSTANWFHTSPQPPRRRSWSARDWTTNWGPATRTAAVRVWRSAS